MKGWDAVELQDVQEVMQDRLDGLLAPGERLQVQGGSSEDEVHATFVLEGGPDGARVLLEARVDLRQTAVPEEDARDLALDALDFELQGWLEGGRTARLAGVSEARELGGKGVWVRAERTFPALEAQADALLAQGEPDSGS